MAIKYQKSASGFYKVDLARTFEHEGFLYKPAQDVTVNEGILEAMIAAEVVTKAVPA